MYQKMVINGNVVERMLENKMKKNNTIFFGFTQVVNSNKTTQEWRRINHFRKFSYKVGNIWGGGGETNCKPAFYCNRNLGKIYLKF